MTLTEEIYALRAVLQAMPTWAYLCWCGLLVWLVTLLAWEAK